MPFLESINSPMLVANMDARDEPAMQGKYQKSIIIERSNRKIGVIGIILETTYVSKVYSLSRVYCLVIVIFCVELGYGQYR